MFATALAVNFVIPTAPPNPILSVEFIACVNSPVPANVVFTVSELVLVRVIADVKFGTINVPVNVCGFVLNVCNPVPAVKVPLLMIPPWNVTGALLRLFHVPFVPTVTIPVKVLVPVTEFSVTPPMVTPFPIVDVPFTASAVVNPFSVNVPCVNVKFPFNVVVPVPVIVAPFASFNSRFPKALVAPLIACNPAPPFR